MRRLVLRGLLAVVAASVLVAGLTCYRTQQAAIEARQYVADMFGLQIGRSGAGDFEKIREKYRGYEYQFEGEQGCSNEDCVAAFWFPRGGPSRDINIVHPSFLYSVLTLAHGAIASVTTSTVCCHKGGPPFSVQVFEHIASPDFAGPFQERRNLSPPHVSWIHFELTPTATAAQRSRAYAFNLRYMSQFSTCNDATDMHQP